MPGGQGLEQEGGGRGKQQPGADSGLEVNIIPPSFFGRGMILMGVYRCITSTDGTSKSPWGPLDEAGVQ